MSDVHAAQLKSSWGLDAGTGRDTEAVVQDGGRGCKSTRHDSQERRWRKHGVVYRDSVFEKPGGRDVAMAMQQEVVAAGESYVGMVCAEGFASDQDPASHCAGIVPELLASVA